MARRKLLAFVPTWGEIREWARDHNPDDFESADEEAYFARLNARTEALGITTNAIRAAVERDIHRIECDRLIHG
jgi:hypothetical protein